METNNGTAVAVRNGHSAPSAQLMEQVALAGDLASLTAKQRLDYYGAVCESLGLNPLTKPFDFLKLNGKLQMYARKDCTDQLRSLHRVSIAIVNREKVGDVYVVTARATLADGRADEATGAVACGALKGDDLANALMKAETKAKRRVTLSIVGLGILDESETHSIAGASRVDVDMTTGEVLSAEAPQRVAVATPSFATTSARQSEPTADEVRAAFETDPYGTGSTSAYEAPDNDSVASEVATGFDWRSVEITFGKHKGKTLGQVPDEYIEWLERSWEPKPRNDGSFWPDAVALRQGITAWASETQASTSAFIAKDKAADEATTNALSF